MENSSIFQIPTRRFIQKKINGGIILLVVAILAMIIANTHYFEHYNSFFDKSIHISFGDFNLLSVHGANMTVRQFINDGLMAIFFFAVGLEIKREMLVGELSSVKKALLPVIAAIGGMIVPIVIFFLLSSPGLERNGAAIPMATDIAFSLGVLSLLGKKVPLSLKIFLTAFAVVDDIGGIIVIGAFYSGHISTDFLLLCIPFLAIAYIGGRFFGVVSKLFYITIGVVVWYLFLNSGIHPTISGVIMALMIPARPRLNIRKYIAEIRSGVKELPILKDQRKPIMLSSQEMSVLKYVESVSDRVISPLQSLDDSLNPLINYVIMPLFAFANAGIRLQGLTFESVTGIALTIFIALSLGKLIGIFSFTFITVKTKLLTMPDNVDYKGLFGVSVLGGIGFTVSLFIANLSFADVPDVGAELLNQAKLGIVSASVWSGIIGYFILDHVYKVPLKEDQV